MTGNQDVEWAEMIPILIKEARIDRARTLRRLLRGLFRGRSGAHLRAGARAMTASSMSLVTMPGI